MHPHAYVHVPARAPAHAHTCLGKTIQVCAFLATLYCSNKWTGPVLIVCPATVMKQWVMELHDCM